MFLRTIWFVSAGFAAVALTVMAILIVLRLESDRRARRRLARRQAMLASLLNWLEGTLPEDSARELLRRDRRIATLLLIEIFELVRGEDQERLARLAEETGLPDYLRRQLAKGDRGERLNAAESLVWFPSEATRAALLFALDDRRRSVAMAAALSLAQFGHKVPIGRVLERQLAQGGESSRQLEALLIRIAPRQTEDLAALAQDAKGAPRVRAAAIEALGRSGAFEFIEPLAQLARDPSPTVRAAVARSLGVFAHPLGGAAVTALLDDPEWEVRAEAAEAEGRIGFTEAAGRLADLLRDQNWWVRFRAAEALAGLGAAGVEILRRIGEDTTDPRQQIAALTLAERGLT